MKISTINIYPGESQNTTFSKHVQNKLHHTFLQLEHKQKSTLIIVVVGVVYCHHLQPMSIVRSRIGPIPLLRVAVRRQPADAALLRLHSGCSRSYCWSAGGRQSCAMLRAGVTLLCACALLLAACPQLDAQARSKLPPPDPSESRLLIFKTIPDLWKTTRDARSFIRARGFVYKTPGSGCCLRRGHNSPGRLGIRVV